MSRFIDSFLKLYNIYYTNLHNNKNGMWTSDAFLLL